jgi:hypothetical protein
MVSARIRTVSAVGAALGGAALFVAAIPPAWFGAASGDSYVFDPPPFSPLWIDRVLLPALAMLGTLALLLALGVLLHRDWQTSRLLRWGGGLTLLGGLSVTVGLYGPELVSAETTVVPTTALAGLALVLWGLLLSLGGVPLVALAYVRAGKRRFGLALVGLVPAGFLFAWALPAPVGALVGALVWAVVGGVLAWELWIGTPASEDLGS